MVWIYTSPAFI